MEYIGTCSRATQQLAGVDINDRAVVFSIINNNIIELNSIWWPYDFPCYSQEMTCD